MRSGTVGVRPVSGRGLVFLLAFVSFLALILIGPHIHGLNAAPTPVVSSAAAAAVTPDAAPSGAVIGVQGEHGQPGDDSLGVAAACVLVLLLTIGFFAARAAPRLAVARPRPAVRLRSVARAPRGLPLPLFRLLSISRT
ncbi:hypothetical protein [Leucobacter komagatae]|uniref:Uncharacterized protein n=1 Tax=Leucobacter komagatae TaxID=55969 RepID=A0A0D0IQH3_9MICO|nr:hypothetical protein [Leucobacter komagatae]KIP53282.1 hypothetical protein SD72_03230 [Leucobacter komagatae]